MTVSFLLFSYEVKIYNKNIKRSLKIFGKDVKIREEKMGYIYFKDLFGSLFLYDNTKELNKIVKARNKIIKFLFLASDCSYFYWVSKFNFSDHALTAFFSGVLWSVKVNTIALLDDKIKLTRRPMVSVKPFFKKNIVNQTSLLGIFNYKLGNIILMTVNRLINKLKKEGA